MVRGQGKILPKHGVSGVLSQRKRHRRRMEKDIESLSNNLTDRGTGRENGFLKQETRWEIQKIKTRMQEILQMYGQQMLARHEWPCSEESEELEEIKQRWHSWALAMHKQNEQSGEEATRSEAWIERTAYPSFDGNQENWAGFRRVFQELMKTSGGGEVLELAQLISKLPV